MKILSRLLCLSAVAALSGVAAAHAQVVTPNPPPTIITTQPYVISSAGFYQLGANLSSSATSGDIITVNANNVTIDLGGHFISGPADNPASTINGIHATEHGNINIRNGTVANCYRGINLEGNGSSTSINYNHRVENLLVTHCFFEGIRFLSAYYSVASNCRISFTGSNYTGTIVYGIYASGGSGNQITDNTITDTGNTGSTSSAYGILGSSDLTVIGNVINTVTAPSGGTSVGISNCAFADHNKVYSATIGISSASKYADNLTVGCMTAFSGGVAVGNGNN